MGEDVQGSKRWNIEDQIKKENERRASVLDQQKDLTYEQIENLRRQNERMARGDAMITIDGAGLQPHLEAFMFEILSAIQIRANAEGANFLVGL